MDCEKFEATMLDELYGELDELTLAASKRHVGGCARCSSLMAGLRATRKLVTLPVLAPSEGFESRLLLAVQAAEHEKKVGLGFAQIISLAGRWAMRPQTAMAAVFLLMIGTSSVLLSRKAPRNLTSEGAAAPMTVTENGAPASAPLATAASTPVNPDLDSNAAAAAHGTPPLPPAAVASAAPTPPKDALEAQAERTFATKPKALGHASFLSDDEHTEEKGGGGALGGYGRVAGNDVTNHSDPRFAPPPPPIQALAPQAAPAPVADVPRESAGPLKKEDGAFGAAKQQYRVGDYRAATQAFDQLAAGGDTNAALWAARSARDGAGGCAAALPKFEQVAQSAWGTPTGYDATYEAADCYSRLGRTEEARNRYSRLLTVPSYATRAQNGITSLTAVAARRASAKAAMPAAAAPAAPPATPAAPPPAAVDRK